MRDSAAGVAARFADAESVARWQRWKNDTINWSRREGRAAIVVVKDAHLLTLFVRGEVVKTYSVELGFNWIADKRQEGDGATPEGRYRIVARMDHLSSDYYRALLIDYPNAENRAAFNRRRGRGELPASARIGGLIEIHGSGGRQYDWTNGCVAMTNADIDHLFGRVGVGTPVTIVGSDTYGPLADFASRYGRDAVKR
jgi:murein L,D-transpeptidase YafK